MVNLAELVEPVDAGARLPPLAESGKVIASWGSAGSGKTTLALNLAFEFADLGHRVMLVDFDVRRPSLASALGITDPGASLTAVMRLARQQRLDLPGLERLSHKLKFGKHHLTFLAGMNSPARWSELGGEELKGVLSLARQHFDFVVLDLNDDIDESILGADAAVFRHHGTNSAIEQSDVVLGSFAADPVGVNRFLWEAKSRTFDFWPIANRVRSSVLGRNPERQVRDAFHRSTGLQIKSSLVDDQSALDQAMLRAGPLCYIAKSSKLREGIRLLALDLVEH